MKLRTTLACLLVSTGLGPVAAHEEDGRRGESVVLEPGGGDHFWVFAESPEDLGSGGEFHIYIDAETHPEAKGSLAKFSLGPGGQLPVHRQERTEEFSYFLSGEGVVQTLDDGEMIEVPVTEGSVWRVSPGAWHAIRNTSDEPLALIFVTIPNEEKGLLSFFRRIGTKPGQEPTPLAPEDFARLASEHDLILRPPEPTR